MNNKKLITGIIVLISILLLFYYQVNKRGELNEIDGVKQSLVICDVKGGKSSNLPKATINEEIQQKSLILEDFYTTLQDRGRWQQNIEYIYKNIGTDEFLDGTMTPLFGLRGQFQVGNLIQIKVEKYIEVASGNSNAQSPILSIKVGEAKKLNLPTRQDFVDQALQTLNDNKQEIFQCARARAKDYVSFEDGIESIVEWDRNNKQAIVWYKASKNLSETDFKFINATVILDDNAQPVSIWVDSGNVSMRENF